MEKLFNFQDFKYSIRDLTRSYKKISTIIFTLFISLFVLSIIISLEYSLKKELNSNAKILLGGDLEINTRNERVNDEYLIQLKKLGDVSSTVEFSTMLADSKKQNAKTFFIRLKAVDDKYPLYGNVESFPNDALSLLQKTPNSIVVNKKIFETLNLKTNSTDWFYLCARFFWKIALSDGVLFYCKRFGQSSKKMSIALWRLNTQRIDATFF